MGKKCDSHDTISGSAKEDGMRLERIVREVREGSKGSVVSASGLAIPVEPHNIAPVSIIGPGLVVQGDLEGADELRVSGKVNGNIRCSRLLVETGSRISGNIVAQEVIVRGEIKGRIRAQSVTLQECARVEAEIYHTLLVIERGARFEGMARHRENPMQCIDQEIMTAAAEQGADPISLKYLVRPLLALRNDERGDALAWATELSLVTAQHDPQTLSEAKLQRNAKG
jgi:cytoskeletal protein CcmA (bactofilin family)